jgi:alkylhydroperoxidase/carboxymuconolactone decarboxylase family protein YurZ
MGSAEFDDATAYFNDPNVMRDFELLARYRAAVFDGYMTLRKAAYNTAPDAALTPKMQELVVLGIEIARAKTNPPPINHARRAIECGATPAEVAEVASLCIAICGMLTYQESGRFALRAAEERYEEIIRRPAGY